MPEYFTASEWSARGATIICDDSKCVRLFVSGDRSQVGKSSCCLALLAMLLDRLDYEPHQVAYIKPATQCESVQLVSRFCEERRVECVPVGPVVFYSGFTREYLAGNTKSADEMADEVRIAVDALCIGKRVVIIDGVGYPAVGSIVGFSNAVSAKATGAPVIIICPKGVGNAVDSYNMNKTYFEANGVQVLGAIFNRLPVDGFYSRENCEEAVSQYFSLYETETRAFGFIPEVPELVDASPPPVANSNQLVIEQPATSRPWSTEDDKRIVALVNVFSKYCDVRAIIQAASSTREAAVQPEVASRRTSIKRKILSRDEIVQQAVKKGAASGA